MQLHNGSLVYELRFAFPICRVFDQEKKGYVAAGDLRFVLSNLGNAITEGEIQEIITALDQVHIAAFEQFIHLH